MIRLPAAALLVLLPRLASAQILTLPSYTTDPGNWIAGGVTALQTTALRDDSRNAYWQVDGVTAYRVAIEKSGANGTTVGAAVTISNPSLLVNTTAVGLCPLGCRATASVMHYQLTYRTTSAARGSSPVAELAVGGMRLGDVRASTGTSLAPDRTVLTLSGGGGLAFALSSTFQIEIVQEYTSIFGGGGFSGATTQWGTRVGIRFGFGAKD